MACLLLGWLSIPAGSPDAIAAEPPAESERPVDRRFPGADAGLPGAGGPSAPVPQLQPAGAPGDLDAAIFQALDQADDWKFFDAPLRDVVDSISAKAGVDVILDTRALDEIGVGADVPVTIVLQDVSLRSFLRLALRPLELTFLVRDGAILVTTAESAASRLSVRVYPVADLIDDEFGSGAVSGNFDSMIRVITSTIAPNTWRNVGGPAGIRGAVGSLVVSQTEAVHDELREFLGVYREVVASYVREPAAVSQRVTFVSATEDASLRNALKRPASIEVIDAPLQDVVEMIAATAKVPVILDHRALEDVGLDVDTPVTATAKNLPLRIVLQRVLSPMDLAWQVRNETLVVTTQEKCEQSLIVGFYPVWDLTNRYPAASDDGSTPVDPADIDFGALTVALTETVAPESWQMVGGPATVSAIESPPILVVSQSERRHHEVEATLTSLRASLAANEAALEGSRPDAERTSIVTYAVNPSCQPQDVADLLVQLTGEAMWEPEDTLLDSLGGMLVVRQTPEAHRHVRKLLRELNAVYSVSPSSGGFGGGGGLGGGGFGGGGAGFGGGGGGLGGGGFF